MRSPSSRAGRRTSASATSASAVARPRITSAAWRRRWDARRRPAATRPTCPSTTPSGRTHSARREPGVRREDVMATDGGRARSEVVRLALAQIDCALGDVAENARRVRQALTAPTARSADIVVFPELTLTGYSLGHVGEDVSRAVADPEIAGLAAEAHDTAFVVGFAEAGTGAHLQQRRLRRGRARPAPASQALPAQLRHLGGAQALHPRVSDARLRHRLRAHGHPALQRAWQPALVCARGAGRRQGADRSREQHGQAPGHRGAVARHHPLLRPHAAVLRRVRQPRRPGAGIARSGAAPTSTARRASSSPRRRATSPPC